MRTGILIVAAGLLLAAGCGRMTDTADTEITEQDIAKAEEELARMKEKLAQEKAAGQEAASEAAQAGESGRSAASEAARPAAPPAGASAAAPAKAARTQPKAPAPPPVKKITLEAGTPIVVRTTNTISTKTARTGERFTATLEEPLMAGMEMIAPKGATVEGVIVEATKGGRVKGKAVLAVALTSIVTDTGERIEITTNTIGNQAKSAKKKDAMKVGIGAAAGAIIGAIAGGGKGAAIGAGVGAGAGTAGVLLTRGNAAEIPSETVLQFELAEPVTVTLK